METDLIEKEIKLEEKIEVKGKEITSQAKKAIIWFIVLNILLSGAIYFLASNNQNIVTNNDEILFFSSPTCPHCKNVEEFIQNNSLNSKINITQKNVWLPEVAKEYDKLADSCKIVKEARGVPMLYYNNSCYLGDIEAIKVLKNIGGLE